ncbi:Armadillo repeat-containing protein 2 [Myotis brandtii]|uniref:Armadillo repeat-containing protein 2 n=1 Tax=Myotis brandtii TaxID=109478 RepID=S7NMC9_MYOBR|nr:Armadillo repeat-containing protein 2 [Myotis brandtii]
MLSPNDQKLEKRDPFYRSLVAKQKTSAEIISEARNALRTVGTQRPFTPQEDQRKLFGPASSRTPENRPPSCFSLHASNFESSDSRPISSARLSPLELKPKAPASPTTEGDPGLSFPKPPVDPVKMRRISSARARLFRAASQGALLPDRTLPPAERKKTVESKDTVKMGDSPVKINGIYLTEPKAVGHLKSHPLQLTYDGGFREIKEQEMFEGATSLPSHLRSGGKLTPYRDCCIALANYSRCYALFLNLINKYQKKQDLVVRIVFILGNLTAKNNQAREQFFKEKESIPTLLSLFRAFYELDLHPERPAGDGDEQPTPQKPQDSGPCPAQGHIPAAAGVVAAQRTALLLPLRCVLHKFMIALLDATHQDMCFSACGVLLNLTVDKDKHAILKEGGGVKKLVGCLRDFGPTDWQLACLVCKTLWNFSENTTNASSCFGDEDTNTLLVLLSSFLDEELALDGSFDQDLKNYHKLHWETEFKPVAQQLLNRIQSHHTFLEPLPIPSF